jgi:hypothetical protein
MLNNHNGFNETEMLERIKAARAEDSSEGTPEPVDAESEEVGLVDEESETLLNVEENAVDDNQEEVVYEESEEIEAGEAEGREEAEESVYLIGDEEITLSELKELRQSELRTADYTRKTQELSEQRKSIEAKEAQISGLTEKLNDVIASYEAQVNEAESVDWDELADLDPSEFLKKKAALEKKQSELEKAKVKRLEIQQLKAAEESQKLVGVMPEWAGESGAKVREKDSEAALKWMRDRGISDQDSANWMDHRVYEAFIKAAKYDSLKQREPAVKKKVSKAPKVTPTKKSAKPRLNKSQEARQRLRKSGSDRDAFEALKGYMSH